MRYYRIFISCILISILLGSCSKEDELQDQTPTKNEAKGSLSFGSLLTNLDRTNFNTIFNKQASIPLCQDSAPKFVRVAVKKIKPDGTWSWVADKNGVDNFIEIEVNPNGRDTNGDNILDSWFTKESMELELDAGKYSIEYFAVLDGNDSNAEIIFMAPRKNDDYGPISFQNYVAKPLPIEVDLLSGEKHYAPVEVICYDKDLAIAFGYLFFDFSNPNFTYICTFGNLCDDLGRHHPAKFRLVVWDFDENGNYNSQNLLVDETNTIRSIGDGEDLRYFGDMICFPLRRGSLDTEFYARLYLVDENNVETLVREGSFTDSFVRDNLYKEEKFSLYHFRENCCGNEDNYPLLEDLTETNCTPKCQPCSGTVTKLELQFIGTNSQNLRIENENLILFSGNISPNDIISLNHDLSLPDLGSRLYFYYDDILQNSLTIDCSENIGPGFLTGDFEMISGNSAEGGILCPVPPGDNPDCLPCSGGVTALSMEYLGDDPANVKLKLADGSILKESYMNKGDIINPIAQPTGTLSPSVHIYINDVEHALLHTDCREAIGSNLISGKFKVLAGASRDGGMLCPVVDEPENCGPCEGKVTELTLKNLGPAGTLKVVQKNGAMIFEGFVALNGLFSFTGQEDKNGKITMGVEILVWRDQASTLIHTSCSQPIGPGNIYGEYEVVSGSSFDGGAFCNPHIE